ncbi:PHP domain-containing protein [Massilimicrobiota timonensis]|uniref:PHP domain-containing protein n=1 Tax=Massilimicrobiota timonensis TaxID=1776392 RepID=A0ABT7UHE0_9FIRM|nr:PHP domain-containing protein [Massilimicrobiota timonensis]MDM8194907.1 PHP domain-containing protein [Massilimicrobiota timonensis]
MMTKSYIDLHMHSMYSDDGEYTPTQLVDMCHEAGVKIMAIADHNWVKANEEAKKHADELGMTYIPAIEIDCTYKGVNLHVLGYGIDNQEVFNQLGEDIEKQEIACSMKKLELTNALGFDLKKEQLDTLSTNGVYTGEMFGEALLNDSRYEAHELLKPYRQGGERSDNPYVNFYWDYYAQGKPCYTEIHFPTLEETIQLIHQHGGVALLAHPGNNLKGQFELFDEMVALGLDGVECFSSYHTTETNEYFYNKAKELNVLYTCGSDFHGKTKPSIHLGENGCLNPQEIEDCLKAHHLI